MAEKSQKPKPDIALKRLAKLIGTWKIKGRTLDSDYDNISGQVKIDWVLGGFYMIQHSKIKAMGFKVHSLEIIGHDPASKTFPSYVFSDVGGSPGKYYWDVRGDVVKHWTNGSIYIGKFNKEGDALSGGWRPMKGVKRAPGNAYDATMIKIKRS